MRKVKYGKLKTYFGTISSFLSATKYCEKNRNFAGLKIYNPEFIGRLAQTQPGQPTTFTIKGLIVVNALSYVPMRGKVDRNGVDVTDYIPAVSYELLVVNEDGTCSPMESYIAIFELGYSLKTWETYLGTK